jgi:hypothetical protein
MTQEPTRWFDEGKFKKLAYNTARAAWRPAWDELCRQNPDQPYSKHYVAGFIEGYVDYLDAGGHGEPPVAAPFCYQLTKYKTPAGIEAAQEWFAGFRYGAAVARASGLRDLILVPLSGPIQPASGAQAAVSAGRAPGQSESPAAPGTGSVPKAPDLPAPQEALPAPRELRDKEGEAPKSPTPWRLPLPASLERATSLPAPGPGSQRISSTGGMP